MNLYMDTSALIKRYVNEAGSEEVRNWLRAAEITATAVITRAEIAAGLSRLSRMNSIGMSEYDLALEQFHSEWLDYHRLPITEPLVARADSLARAHSLRGYDAIHLASALAWQDVLGLSVSLATFDRELLEAGKRAGLAVLPSE